MQSVNTRPFQPVAGPEHPQSAARRVLTSWVAGPAAMELKARAASPNSLQDVWQKRQDMFERHVAKLTFGQLALWGLRQVSDRVMCLRAPLTRTMFPITTMRFHNDFARYEDFRAEQPPGRAANTFKLEALGLLTPDHVLLDGMLVTYSGHTAQDSSWPTVMFVPPNGMVYEEMLVAACQFAEQYRAKVVLFNYRGIGKSLGQLRSIEDAVVDTTTCLAHACSLGANVGVLGLSMGGGTGAAAVKRLHEAGVLQEGELSLFLAVHTFSSWFDVARGRSGLLWARTFFGLARLLGMKDLATYEYLQNHRLAQHTLIAEASMEQVLPSSARLGHQRLPADHAQVFWNAGARHADLSFLTSDASLSSQHQEPSLRAHLHRWRSELDAVAAG